MKVLNNDLFERLVDFYIGNIERYFNNQAFEFSIVYLKSKDLEYAKQISNTLRQTDLVFEVEGGMVILLAGTNIINARDMVCELSEYLSVKNINAIVSYPFDGKNAKELFSKLDVLVKNKTGKSINNK